MRCLHCGATNPDSEDVCPATHARHVLVSASDKQQLGQGKGPGPGKPGEQGDPMWMAGEHERKKGSIDRLAEYRGPGRYDHDDPIEPHLEPIQRLARTFHEDPDNHIEILSHENPQHREKIRAYGKLVDQMIDDWKNKMARHKGPLSDSDLRTDDGLWDMRTALSDVPASERRGSFVAVAKHKGDPVAAMDFTHLEGGHGSYGELYVGGKRTVVGFLGSARSARGAATAIEHAVAKDAHEHGMDRLESMATKDAVPYHHMIGRVIAEDSTGRHSIWSAEDLADIAALRVHPSDRIKTAHGFASQDIVSHCAFCGSGDIVGGSDGTIHCNFCDATFAVSVEPQYVAAPMTVNGVPYNLQGQPDPNGLATADQGWAVPQGLSPESGEDLSMQGAPSDDYEDADESAPTEDEGSGGGVPAKGASVQSVYLTRRGDPLPYDLFLKHLAISHAVDRRMVLAQVRKMR